MCGMGSKLMLVKYIKEIISLSWFAAHTIAIGRAVVVSYLCSVVAVCFDFLGGYISFEVAIATAIDATLNKVVFIFGASETGLKNPYAHFFFLIESASRHTHARLFLFSGMSQIRQ